MDIALQIQSGIDSISVRKLELQIPWVRVQPKQASLKKSLLTKTDSIVG